MLVALAWGLAAPVAAQTETIEYYGTDAVGSVRIVFNASGTVLGRQDYDPFGREILSAWGVPPERFGGQTTDGEVQQGYFHARQFQTRTARFLTPDSVFDLGSDAQGWNRYQYALSNPLSRHDYTGLDPECFFDREANHYYCHTVAPQPGTGAASGNGSSDRPGPGNWTGGDDRNPDLRTPRIAIIPPLVGDDTQVRILRKTFVDLNRALEKSKCNGFLGGSSNATQTLLSIREVKATPFPSDLKTAGAKTDPVNRTIQVNASGAFFDNPPKTLLFGGNRLTMPAGDLARRIMMLHEVGHVFGIFGADSNNPALNAQYTMIVMRGCS